MISTNMTIVDMIKDCEEIIMDTSSLMEVERLNYMINNYRNFLEEQRKTIIIPGGVCQELVRHLTSNNEDKKEKADKALKIIRYNADLFTVEFADYTPEKVRKAFADLEILLRLSSSRALKRQLLITNDRSLSKDAHSLNSLESCSGKPVQVCYLSRYGELCKCDCETKEHSESTREKIIINKEPVYVEVQANPKATDIYINIIGAIALLGAGYGTCKYGHHILKSVMRNF